MKLKKTLYGVPGTNYAEPVCSPDAMLSAVMRGIVDGAHGSISWRENNVGGLGEMGDRQFKHDECVKVTITVERVGRKKGNT